MIRSFRSTVEAGYDLIAERYLATKDPQDPVALSALEKVASELRPKATVLDLGCGAGIPAARWLAQRFTVTGVDFFSARQLDLARENAPDTTLATWAVGAWGGEEEDWEGWGAPVLWSHYDGETSFKMLREAGFEVARSEKRTGEGALGEETWLSVLARRSSEEKGERA